MRDGKHSRSFHLASRFATLAGFAAAAAAFPVLAHEGQGPHIHGYADGFLHPFTGWDHILAMLAVGLWAAQQGKRAVWLVPTVFVGVMALSGLAGHQGLYLPLGLIESGILASVLVLGLLIATATRMPLWAGGLLVGVFAASHGLAHGIEGAGGRFATYGLGFVLATALLHGAGIASGLLAGRYGQSALLRAAGGAIALLAIVLMTGLL